MPRVGGVPGGPEAAEDVRHLELRPGHASGSGRWRSSEVEQLERTLHPPDRVEGNPGLACRRGDLAMPQQVLDHRNRRLRGTLQASWTLPKTSLFGGVGA